MRIPTWFYRDGWWQVAACPLFFFPFLITESAWRWLGAVPVAALAWLSWRRRIEETGR